jgi:hypothetical protein
MQPEDRAGRRILAVIGLVFLVALLAAALAAGLYGVGRFVVRAIQTWAGESAG